MIKITTITVSITIAFILILFSGFGMNSLEYYENRINEVKERVQQLESQDYGSLTALFMFPLTYASSDNDDDQEDDDDNKKF